MAWTDYNKYCHEAGGRCKDGAKCYQRVTKVGERCYLHKDQKVDEPFVVKAVPPTKDFHPDASMTIELDIKMGEDLYLDSMVDALRKLTEKLEYEVDHKAYITEIRMVVGEEYFKLSPP